MGKNHVGKNKNDPIEEFKNKIDSEPICKIPVNQLVKPDGHAALIAKRLNITRVQLRKIYAELKYIFDRIKQSGSFDEEIEARLYMLYPILEYQKNRKVIDSNFVDLMFALLDNLSKYKDKSNFEQAEKFLTALVAYTKKES